MSAHAGPPQTAEELGQAIAALIEESADLHRRGIEELVARFGSNEKIPLQAFAESELMAQGYTKVAEALTEAAALAFNFVSAQAGATGAQAGFASMQLLGRLQRIEGPYMVVRAGDYLYPQYDGRVRQFLEGPEVRQFLHERALEGLTHSDPIAPDVMARYSLLAAAPDTWRAYP